MVRLTLERRPVLLHGRYEVQSILKQGGMGAVYRATDSKLAGSSCAIKEILAEKQGDAYFQARFQAEMRALARLDHPSIPRVRDFFQIASKSYLVMDLVQGSSLEDELEQQGPNSAARTVRDMLQVLDVLEYLHGQKPAVIHRDIKPANLLREERTGRIKVVDFGLARTTEAGEGAQTAVGTAGYCAPEQIFGRADHRSDLFAVGATMLHLLAGEPCNPLAIMVGIEVELPTLAPGLLPILQKAMQFLPDQRYATAREMAIALDAWLVEFGHRHHLSSSRWRLGVEQTQAQPLLAPPPPEPAPVLKKKPFPMARAVSLTAVCGLLMLGSVGNGPIPARPTVAVRQSAPPPKLKGKRPPARLSGPSGERSKPAARRKNQS